MSPLSGQLLVVRDVSGLATLVTFHLISFAVPSLSTDGHEGNSIVHSSDQVHPATPEADTFRC
jgi:hypothetical protein